MLGVVTNRALDTFFGKTVALVAQAQREEKSHFQKAVINIGNYLIMITVFLAAVMLVTAMLRHENMLEILRFALVLTVAALPVAMPAILSVTMTVGATTLAKKQAVVSRRVAIEELAGVDILCSDKTGTLTQNRMTVADPVTAEGHEVNELLLLAALASREENSDSIEMPIFEKLQAGGAAAALAQYRQTSFTPFDPVGKRTEAVVETENKSFIVTKGAPQVIFGLYNDNRQRPEMALRVEEFADDGFRTLGVVRKRRAIFRFRRVDSPLRPAEGGLPKHHR